MSKEILKKTMAEQREERLDAKLKALAMEGRWGEVIAELDHFDENNERRHREHRDDRDLTLLDRQHCEGEYGFIGLRSLCRTEDWDEIIFSQDPEELYQLVEEYPVSAALAGTDTKAEGDPAEKHRLGYSDKKFGGGSWVQRSQYYEAAAEGIGTGAVAGDGKDRHQSRKSGLKTEKRPSRTCGLG